MSERDELLENIDSTLRMGMMSLMVALNLMQSDADKNLAHDHAQVVPMTLFVAVLCLCLVIGHLLEESRWINESIVAIFVVRHK